MRHKLKVVFGKEQVNKVYSNVPLNSAECNLNIREYYFDTIEEKNAFCKGLDEAIGWLEYCLPDYMFEEKHT